MNAAQERVGSRGARGFSRDELECGHLVWTKFVLEIGEDSPRDFTFTCQTSVSKQVFFMKSVLGVSKRIGV